MASLRRSTVSCVPRNGVPLKSMSHPNTTASPSFRPGAAVVVRSVGERTEALCSELVSAQGIAEGHIAVIREAPFARALQASYEAGIRMGCEWTLCVDADVLLFSDAIPRMLRLAQRQKPSVFELNWRVLDKFFGGPRPAGLHLYRTALLVEALRCIPQEHAIRPESSVFEAMQDQGFPWLQMKDTLGLHGFEQYYRDIFRTCFVHAHKHPQYAELFLSHWRAGRTKDRDYDVALKGFLAGIEYDGEVVIDSQNEIILRGFERLQIAEKPPLRPGELSGSDVGQLVSAWKVPADFYKYYRRPVGQALSLRFKELGLLKLLPFAVGSALERTGVWLRTLARPK